MNIRIGAKTDRGFLSTLWIYTTLELRQGAPTLLSCFPFVNLQVVWESNPRRKDLESRLRPSPDLWITEQYQEESLE